MPGTILIVEDHDAVRCSLQKWLKGEFPQHLVLGVTSAEEALAVCQRMALDVIIMDVNLPQMSGIEATRQIIARGQDTQILMLTIHEEEAYRADALAAGACAFVPKRTMHTELLPALSALLPANVSS
jgi:DNA-binding NarL/FixJ family response regulator